MSDKMKPSDEGDTNGKRSTVSRRHTKLGSLLKDIAGGNSWSSRLIGALQTREEKDALVPVYGKSSVQITRGLITLYTY
jgi:hypothetical protein